MLRVNGLEGTIVAQTELSHIDGKHGQLVFRGFDVTSLATTYTFEDIAFLLWNGRLPDDPESTQLRMTLSENRTLPRHVMAILDFLPDNTELMAVLRTALSALSVDNQWPPTQEEAIRFTAIIPTILTYWYAKIRHVSPTEPNKQLSHVANYLFMLFDGTHPLPEHVQTLETYLVLAMEHGMSASTFTARVVTSTQSDIASALVAAVGAMKGPLHGGAPSKVMNMLEQIGSRNNTETWLRKEIDAGNRLMGFGHRVYKTQDPRAVALCEVVKRMHGKDEWFDFAVQVEETAIRLLSELKPGRNLYTNVEFWAAAVFRALHIPVDLYTPTFTVGRVVGWTAHILEQAAHNRIIRPEAEYIGKQPK